MPLFSTGLLQQMSANNTIRSVEEAFKQLAKVYEHKPHSLFDSVGRLVSSGLTSLNSDNIHIFVSAMAAGEASSTNQNIREPKSPIYPQVSENDAPYNIPEAKLRAAIHIPEAFQYGAPDAQQPILLVGGTGNPGYVTWSGSYIPLLQAKETSFGDPVWVNIPDFSLDDIQANAEYVAYAIHYISSISNGRKIAVFGYSQGNLDAQWAYKYWPSTRDKVTDHVAFSPGYHGTELTNLLAMIPQPPAWLQSTYDSNLVAAMRSGGGDSALVPTTIIYSATDEVVQPQTGPAASSRLRDDHGTGVSNTMVQDACEGKPAGGFYTHEGMMLNPLAYALARDALEHDGPGQLSRVDLDEVCAHFLAPGLGIEHFILTENTAVFAAAVTLLYHGKSWSEPALQAYAQKQ
ncbi:hypothetical protein BX600DRAFT_506165 [Xylariales sp. PMI_506]|nr:hypothetical protein BX600DRAFT_506165 [Xylariales sp. PMI_506]